MPKSGTTKRQKNSGVLSSPEHDRNFTKRAKVDVAADQQLWNDAATKRNFSFPFLSLTK